MNVKLFQLTGGQQIVTELTGESNDRVQIKNPIILVVSPTEDQQNLNVSFSPLISPFSKQKEIQIEKKHILYGPVDPVDELLQNYQSQFSNIITPSGGGIASPTNQGNPQPIGDQQPQDAEIVNMFETSNQ